MTYRGKASGKRVDMPNDKVKLMFRSRREFESIYPIDSEARCVDYMENKFSELVDYTLLDDRQERRRDSWLGSVGIRQRA